jgi:hypothetical protein
MLERRGRLRPGLSRPEQDLYGSDRLESSLANRHGRVRKLYSQNRTGSVARATLRFNFNLKRALSLWHTVNFAPPS